MSKYTAGSYERSSRTSYQSPRSTRASELRANVHDSSSRRNDVTSSRSYDSSRSSLPRSGQSSRSSSVSSTVSESSTSSHLPTSYGSSLTTSRQYGQTGPPSKRTSLGSSGSESGHVSRQSSRGSEASGKTDVFSPSPRSTETERSRFGFSNPKPLSESNRGARNGKNEPVSTQTSLDVTADRFGGVATRRSLREKKDDSSRFGTAAARRSSRNVPGEASDRSLKDTKDSSSVVSRYGVALKKTHKTTIPETESSSVQLRGREIQKVGASQIASRIETFTKSQPEDTKEPFGSRPLRHSLREPNTNRQFENLRNFETKPDAVESESIQKGQKDIGTVFDNRHHQKDETKTNRDKYGSSVLEKRIQKFSSQSKSLGAVEDVPYVPAQRSLKSFDSGIAKDEDVSQTTDKEKVTNRSERSGPSPAEKFLQRAEKRSSLRQQSREIVASAEQTLSGDVFKRGSLRSTLPQKKEPFEGGSFERSDSRRSFKEGSLSTRSSSVASESSQSTLGPEEETSAVPQASSETTEHWTKYGRQTNVALEAESAERFGAPAWRKAVRGKDSRPALSGIGTAEPERPVSHAFSDGALTHAADSSDVSSIHSITSRSRIPKRGEQIASMEQKTVKSTESLNLRAGSQGGDLSFPRREEKHVDGVQEQLAPKTAEHDPTRSVGRQILSATPGSATLLDVSATDSLSGTPSETREDRIRRYKAERRRQLAHLTERFQDSPVSKHFIKQEESKEEKSKDGLVTEQVTPLRTHSEKMVLNFDIQPSAVHTQSAKNVDAGIDETIFKRPLQFESEEADGAKSKRQKSDEEDSTPSAKEIRNKLRRLQISAATAKSRKSSDSDSRSQRQKSRSPEMEPAAFSSSTFNFQPKVSPSAEEMLHQNKSREQPHHEASEGVEDLAGTFTEESVEVKSHTFTKEPTPQPQLATLRYTMRDETVTMPENVVPTLEDETADDREEEKKPTQMNFGEISTSPLKPDPPETTTAFKTDIRPSKPQTFVDVSTEQPRIFEKETKGSLSEVYVRNSDAAEETCDAPKQEDDKISLNRHTVEVASKEMKDETVHMSHMSSESRNKEIGGPFAEKKVAQVHPFRPEQSETEKVVEPTLPSKREPSRRSRWPTKEKPDLDSELTSKKETVINTKTEMRAEKQETMQSLSASRTEVLSQERTSSATKQDIPFVTTHQPTPVKDSHPAKTESLKTPTKEFQQQNTSAKTPESPDNLDELLRKNERYLEEEMKKKLMRQQHVVGSSSSEAERQADGSLVPPGGKKKRISPQMRRRMKERSKSRERTEAEKEAEKKKEISAAELLASPEHNKTLEGAEKSQLSAVQDASKPPTDSDSTLASVTDSLSQSITSPDDHGRKKRKDKSAARKSQLNAYGSVDSPKEPPIEVGDHLNAEASSTPRGQRSSERTKTTPVTPEEVQQATEQIARQRAEGKVSSALTKFQIGEKKEPDLKPRTTVDDSLKLSKPFARGKDFSALLEKFSSSASSDSAENAEKRRPKVNARKLDFPAAFSRSGTPSSDESTSDRERPRRTPERTGSLKERAKQFEGGQVTRPVQRSSSFKSETTYKSDFMKHIKQKQEQKSETQEGKDLVPSKQSMGIVSSVTEQNTTKIVTDTADTKEFKINHLEAKISEPREETAVEEVIQDPELRDVLKSRRKHSDAEYHDAFEELPNGSKSKSSASEIKEVIADDEVARVLQARRQDTDANITDKDDVFQDTVESFSPEKATRRNIRTVVSAKVETKQQMHKEAIRTVEQGEKLMVKSSRNVEQISSVKDLSQQKIEHVEKASSRSSRKGEHSDIVQASKTVEQTGKSHVQTSVKLEKAEKISVESSRKFEQTSMRVEQGGQVRSKPPNGVSAKTVVKKEETTAKEIVKSRKSKDETDPGEKAKNGSDVSTKQNGSSEPSKSQTKAPETATSFVKQDSIEKPVRGILKRSSSSASDYGSQRQQGEIPMDPELAKVLQGRKKMVESVETEESQAQSEVDKRDIIRQEISQTEVHKSEVDEEEEARPVSIAERIFMMENRIEEAKSCPVTPRTRSGFTTPRSRARSGASTPRRESLESLPEDEEGPRKNQLLISDKHLMAKLESMAEKEQQVAEKRKKFNRRTREDWRTRTLPVTLEEIQEADRLSLADKLKLFNRKPEEKAPVPPHRSEAPVIRRRNRKQASRFNTQPITTEEVEKASKISPLAMSMAAPPDNELLRSLPIAAQIEMMAQHAEANLSQPSSRAGSRAGSQPSSRRSSVGAESADLEEAGILKTSENKDPQEVKSILKHDGRKASDSEIRGILKDGGKESPEPTRGILKHGDSEGEITTVPAEKSPEERSRGILKHGDSSEHKEQKSALRRDSKGKSEGDLPRSILKRDSLEENKLEPDKGVLKKSRSQDFKESHEIRGILKKTASSEVKSASCEVTTGQYDSGELYDVETTVTAESSTVSEQTLHQEESVVTQEVNGETKSTESSVEVRKTSKIKNEAVARRRSRENRKAETERYLTQPADTGASEKTPEQRRLKYGAQRHHTQPVTPEEKEAAEATGSEMSNQNSGSIAERLNLLKKSGEEDWKRRVRPELGLSEEVKLRVKSGPSLERPNSIAERLNQLGESQQRWTARVEETDAKAFTVEGKQSKSGIALDSPVSTRKRRLPKRELSFGKADSAQSSDTTPLQSPSRDKIPLPKELISADPPVMSVSTSVTSSSTSSKTVVTKYTGDQDTETDVSFMSATVEVPQISDESFNTFFSMVENNLKEEKVEVTVDDFDDLFLKAEDVLTSARRIRPNRRHIAKNRNPLKTQSVEIQSEYTEFKTGVAEMELRRIKRQGLAKESGSAQVLLAEAAVKGLQSTESFNIELRKTKDAKNTPGGSDSLPYKDLMLLLVKGRRHIQTRLVEPTSASVNSGDSYILVTPKSVVNWNGQFSNVIEKAKAADIAMFISQKKDLGYRGSGPALTIEEGKQRHVANKNFWSKLEGNPSSQEPGPPDEDGDYECYITETNMVYRVENHTLLPYEDYWGKIPKIEMLKADEVLVFDFGSELYVWHGQQVSMEQRKLGMRLATQLWERGYDYSMCTINPLSPLWEEEEGGTPSKCDRRPSWAVFGKVNQNMETTLFKEKFFDWPESSRFAVRSKTPESFALKPVDVNDLEPYDAKLLIPLNTSPVTMVFEGSHVGRGDKWVEEMDGLRREFDVLTLEVNVWHVLEYDHYKLHKQSYGQFHDGDTYVVRWQYMITAAGLKTLKGHAARHSLTGRERCAYFFWQGHNSTVNEKGASALMTVELDEERGPQVRVLQGQEPPCFLNLFEGRSIIHIGKREEAETNTQGHYRLYLVRNEYENETCLLEIPLAMESLRSRTSLLLLNVKTGLLFIWHGAKSLSHTRKLAKAAANKLKDKCPLEVGLHDRATIIVSEMEEGSEKSEFWTAIGNRDRTLYQSLLKDDRRIELSPRLFYMNSVAGVFEAKEILNPVRSHDLVSTMPFLQTDLYKVSQPGLFMLDDVRTVYLWQGWWPEGDEDSENVHTGSAQARFNTDRICAMKTAIQYCSEKCPSDPPEARLVFAGVEPLCFTNLFPTWEADQEARDSSLREGRKEGEIIGVEQVLARLTQSEYTMAELRERPLPDGVDPLKLEKYLRDEEFQSVLDMSKEDFYALPGWKQTKLKQKVGLF